MDSLSVTSTALVLIDLQKGILARPTEPHAVADVVANARRLIDAFRAKGGVVFPVHVGFAPDDGDRPLQAVDQPSLPSEMPTDFMEFVPELGDLQGCLPIHKRQWGAFYGTPLELELRRRGVDTIVIGGVSTNFGVESTARDAWERNFNVVFVEDAMASAKAEMHRFAVENIFPRIGRVVKTEAVLAALG